jgi:hypothetical protein
MSGSNRSAMNRRASYRERWWIHGEPRANLRPALAGLNRYIATVETAKHRVFVFLDHTILPDNKLIAMRMDDAYYLGVLSSRIHVTWALAAGSRLGVGNDPVYVKTALLREIPLPHGQRSPASAHPRQRRAARRASQAPANATPTLTLTDMYNVLERLRALDPNPDRQGGAGQGGAGQGGAGQGGAGQGGGWSGRGWSGRGWSGRGWSGRGWSGRGWSGRGWSGRGWSGRGWRRGAKLPYGRGSGGVAFVLSNDPARLLHHVSHLRHLAAR